MLGYAMLMWIGFKLGAPNWYWWCWRIERQLEDRLENGQVD